MTPRLAICFPCAPTLAGYEMVRRSVAALRAQDCGPDVFEVVVAIDGGDPDALHAIADAANPVRPFDLVLVRSPRTPGNEDIPHRNHTRNAAWKAARAPLCWMLDADFILPPHAVRHVLAEHDAAIHRGAPAVLSPCLWQFGGATTEQWWERSAAWADTGDPGAFRDLLATWPEWDRNVFSGFGEEAPAIPHINGAPGSMSVGERMQEGMPLLWRGFLEALGGFDESYVGWGGDKIALIDILHGLCREGAIDIRLVTSVTALHQPHPTDPAYGNPRSNANEKRRWLARMPIQSRTIEWKRRIPGLVTALRAAWADAVPGASPTLGIDPELLPLVEMIATTVQRKAKADHPVVTFGPCAGTLRAQIERAGVREVEQSESMPTRPSSVVAAIDPLGEIGPGGWREAVTRMGARLRALHPSATVVIAQRLDGPEFAGLRPIDIQHEAIKRTRDCRVVKIAGVRYAYISGNV